MSRSGDGGDDANRTAARESMSDAGPADDGPADRADGSGTRPLEVIQSVLAGFIGVQSSRNRERDFTRGKPLHFIVGGLIGTALFLLAVYLFVRVLIATA